MIFIKIDRLIGILSILLQKEKVTAPYLAEKFEVSRRTINRDIEDICMAGIPLVTTQGRNGGISIVKEYKLERTLLTSSDMRAILTGLNSLDSICETKKYQQLMDKLSIEDTSVLPSNQHIVIDLSSWHKDSLAPKIELIQEAIEQKERIQFTYYSPKGESLRVIEPYLLLFQWSSWYVWGFCIKRNDFRMFKLNRAIKIENTKETFIKKEFSAADFSPNDVFSSSIKAHGVIGLFQMDISTKWRLIDEFGIDCIKKEMGNSLLFESRFQDKESLFQWLLSFGNKGELLKPKELREELNVLMKEMSFKYKS